MSDSDMRKHMDDVDAVKIVKLGDDFQNDGKVIFDSRGKGSRGNIENWVLRNDLSRSEVLSLVSILLSKLTPMDSTEFERLGLQAFFEKDAEH